MSEPGSRVMTVLGPRASFDLGTTLMHEHVFIDFNWPELWEASTVPPEILSSDVEISSLGLLRNDPYAIRDNARLNDYKVACEELDRYLRAGGCTIVDLTSIGIGRDVQALRRVSEATGVQIVAGCGWYVALSHPPQVSDAGVDELRDQIIRELTEGVDDTGICAGIIGEIGTSGPVAPDEEKVLRAAVRAHQQTGAALNIHCSAQYQGVGLPRVIQVLVEEDMPPDRTILSHMDQGIALDRVLAAADLGFNLEFDCFGQEHHYTLGPGAYASLPSEPRDTERLATLETLVARGHLSQLLVSQDVFLKMNLRAYGGWGYDHILTDVIRIGDRYGVSRESFEVMLVTNPARILPH